MQWVRVEKAQEQAAVDCARPTAARVSARGGWISQAAASPVLSALQFRRISGKEVWGKLLWVFSR